MAYCVKSSPGITNSHFQLFELLGGLCCFGLQVVSHLFDLQWHLVEGTYHRKLSFCTLLMSKQTVFLSWAVHVIVATKEHEFPHSLHEPWREWGNIIKRDYCNEHLKRLPALASAVS